MVGLRMHDKVICRAYFFVDKVDIQVYDCIIALIQYDIL